MPKVFTAALDKTYVTTREAVDRLPIVANQKKGKSGAPERRNQRHAARRNVLELVDEHVSECVFECSTLNIFSGHTNHVLEVDRPFVGQNLFVSCPEVMKYGKKRAFTYAVLSCACTLLKFFR